MAAINSILLLLLVLFQGFMADALPPPWWVTFGLKEIKGMSYSPGMDIPCNSVVPLETGMTVSFTSTDYPDNYPPLNFCRWLFQGSSDEVMLKLSCEEFNLEPGAGEGLCWLGDFLKITKSADLGDFDMYCGDEGPKNVTSNWMEAKFWSNFFNNDFKGFNCMISAIAGITNIPVSPLPSSVSP